MLTYKSTLSAVVAAVQNSGTKEQALNILTGETELLNTMVEPSTCVDSALPFEVHNDVGSSSTINDVDIRGGNSSCIENENGEKTEEDQRDIEMEEVLAKELTGDPFSDYDIEVVKEGEAITEYLALLASTRGT